MADTRDITGRLRYFVAVEEDQSTSKRSSGERIENWVRIYDAYAEIEPIVGREFFNAVQVQANVTHRITLRVRGDKKLTHDMRIRFGSRIFYFGTPPRNIDERGEFWEAMAVEQITNPG